MHLVTWFHADTADFSSSYAQALGDSTSAGHYLLYERCVRVFFASARRWNPAATLTFVSNAEAGTVFGEHTIALLDRLGVGRVVVPNAHRTPPGYHHRWQNQFFVLDVIDAVLALAPTGPVVICDADCVVAGPVPNDVPGPGGLAALPMPLAPDEAENGLTPRDLADLADDLTGTRPEDPRYFGGELIAMTPAVLRQVRDRAELVFARSLTRRAEGLMAANEEAHVLSVAILSLGLEWRRARFAGRLWTQPWKFRTVRPLDRGLLIWHLPAEKKTGIPRLDMAAADAASWFWSASRDVWLRRAGTMVGVPHYGVTKGIRDMSTLLAARVRRRAVRA